MSKIIEYYNNIMVTDEELEKMSSTFINFYIFFTKLTEQNTISANSLYFLDCALDFSEPLIEESPSTIEYLDTKIFQLEQFFVLAQTSFSKYEKKLKRTFDLPTSYTFAQVKEIIEKSYIFYAIKRYKKNLEITRIYDSVFDTKEQLCRVPDQIPDENVNISEFLEMVSGIKRMTHDGKGLDWFNVFSPELNIRAIVDISDGQIALLYVNGEKHTIVDNILIKELKNRIKKSSNTKKTPAIPGK